jgi:hypothetical protein
MNRDDIIRMAREAHLVMYDYDHPSLERFAALVAAAEREACAKVCEDSVEYAGDELARQIRERNNQ